MKLENVLVDENSDVKIYRCLCGKKPFLRKYRKRGGTGTTARRRTCIQAVSAQSNDGAPPNMYPGDGKKTKKASAR